MGLEGGGLDVVGLDGGALVVGLDEGFVGALEVGALEVGADDDGREVWCVGGGGVKVGAGA